jgi:hypothetical protein
MNYEVKHHLDEQAYEKLRQVIKNRTSFENLNEENIKVTREAYQMLVSWLEEVYKLDRKDISPDEDGKDIEGLFKFN